MGLFKIFLLLLLIALAALFVLKGPDGEPLVTFDDIQYPESLQNLIESIPLVSNPFQDDTQNKEAAAHASGKTKVYSWRDEQGNMHFSNIAPTETAEVETRYIDPNMNIIKMDRPADGETASMHAMPVVEQHESKAPSIIQVYTPQGVNELMDDARAIEKTLQDRKQEYDRAIDSP